jgi:hypothetical protein
MLGIDGIESIKLAPSHFKELKTKFHDAMLLKEHILLTTETFQKYAKAGTKLCEAMGNLAVSFQQFTEFESDRSFRRVSSVLLNLQDSFSAHYASIQEAIVKPMLDFLAGNLKHVETCSKKAARDYDQYTAVLDQFVQPNAVSKRQGRESADLLGRLQRAYWVAVRSDFEFQRALDLVDAKRLPEVALHFVTFLNMASVPYYQAHDAFTEAKESFLALSAATQDSANIDRLFEKATHNIETSLQGYFSIYVRRFTNVFPGTQTLEHEGLLWKQGSGLTKSWQLRYFRVARHAICYHHGASDSDSPQGELDLLCTSVKPLPMTGCFTIISPTKTYNLRAVTDYDRDEWVAVIQNNIEHLLMHGGQTLESADSGEDVVPQDLPFNARCADCGGAGPTWTALNWGVCVCIHCCAVHRAMGASVSRARSLTLDRLPAAALRILEVIGNETANAILEACVESGKITESASREQRDAFIRRKYERREFVDQTPVEVLAAVRDGDYVAVFRAICQGALAAETGYTSLHCAASLGDPVMSLLIGYNLPNGVVLDRGWSPLSYAAFYGHKVVAKSLIEAGCIATETEQVHPYEIAVAQKDEEMALIFLPFWHGQTTTGKEFTPPVPVTTRRPGGGAYG